MVKEDLVYVIPAGQYGKEGVLALLEQHPEIKFVSLVGVDLAGNDTDEKIPISTFFEDYDLFNKTITLFCTSGESGLSDTKKTIQALEPSAPMVKGLYVSKSASKEATSDVKEWVNEIK